MIREYARYNDMLKKYLAIGVLTTVCCFILLSGCNSDKKVKEYAMDFEKISTNEALSIILDLRTEGDTLLVNQFSGDYFLNWFSMETGDLIKSGISKGNGSDEMLGPLMINTIGDSLFIFDRQKFRLYKSNFMCDSIIQYADSIPFWSSQVFPLNNEVNIVSKIPFGICDKEVANTRFAAMLKDSVLFHFGSYPEFSNSDRKSDVEQKAHFHQIQGQCEIPGNKFAVSSSHVLSIYSIENDKYVLSKEIVVSPYEYSAKASSDIVSASTKLKDGYDIGLLNGLVYHSGKIYVPFKRAKDDNISILCYDTELNLIGVIIPDLPIMDPFTIDSNGRVIALIEEEASTNICISKTNVDEIW